MTDPRTPVDSDGMPTYTADVIDWEPPMFRQARLRAQGTPRPSSSTQSPQARLSAPRGPLTLTRRPRPARPTRPCAHRGGWTDSNTGTWNCPDQCAAHGQATAPPSEQGTP